MKYKNVFFIKDIFYKNIDSKLQFTPQKESILIAL